MVVHVLLGGDGDAVASGRAKAPILQCFEHLAVDHRSQALNNNFLDDVTFFVDCDFNNDVALQSAQFVGSDMRVGRNNWQSGTDFFAGQGSFQGRSQRRACGARLSGLAGYASLVVQANLGTGQLTPGRFGYLATPLPGQV